MGDRELLTQLCIGETGIGVLGDREWYSWEIGNDDLGRQGMMHWETGNGVVRRQGMMYLGREGMM